MGRKGLGGELCLSPPTSFLPFLPFSTLSYHRPRVRRHHSAVKMDLILARLGQLEEVALLQEATNQAQASSITELSSVVARLSSENKALKTIVEDQDRVIGELSRACIPSGFWVWETSKGGRDGGCWFSSSPLFFIERFQMLMLNLTSLPLSQEKYRLPPPTVTRRQGPPASLETLPVEIISLIFQSFTRRELALVMETSFQMLRLTTSQMYGTVTMRSKRAVSFDSSRVSLSVPPTSLFVLLADFSLRFCSGIDRPIHLRKQLRLIPPPPTSRHTRREVKRKSWGARPPRVLGSVPQDPSPRASWTRHHSVPFAVVTASSIPQPSRGSS